MNDQQFFEIVKYGAMAAIGTGAFSLIIMIGLFSQVVPLLGQILAELKKLNERP